MNMNLEVRTWMCECVFNGKDNITLLREGFINGVGWKFAIGPKFVGLSNHKTKIKYF